VNNSIVLRLWLILGTTAGCLVEDELLDCWPDCTSAFAYQQSWEEIGCGASDATDQTSADCDYAASPAHGTEVLRIEPGGELVADDAIGSIEGVDTLNIQMALRFESKGNGGNVNIYTTRDGNADAFPVVLLWPAGAQLALVCSSSDAHWGPELITENEWHLVQLTHHADGLVELELPSLGLVRRCPPEGTPAPRTITSLGYAFRAGGNGMIMQVDDLRVDDDPIDAPTWF